MTRRRRILLFTAGHTEPNGGLARHSRLLVEGFVDDGLEVRAISRAGTFRRPRVTRAEHVVVLELPGFGRPRLGAAVYLLVAVPLGLLWSRGSVGCLSVHLGSTTVAAGLVAAARRLPHSALSTSSGPLGEVTEAAGCRPGGLRRRLLRRATYLIGQGPHSADELTALTAPDRIAVVPNPVELPHGVPLEQRGRVLFLGRLSAEKDPATLVAAWRAVVTRCDDARLAFVGTGGDWRSVEHELRDQVAADPALAASVSFAGWASDVPAVLLAHDVFVQSSATFEGMSNSLLEACAHGRVVVASDIAPNRAVLGDAYPLLFRTGDARHLAEQLLRAIQDDEVRQVASVAARAAVERNASQAVIARHLELLERQPAATSR